MNPTGRRPAVLNRAVFTNRTFDSRALSVFAQLAAESRAAGNKGPEAKTKQPVDAAKAPGPAEEWLCFGGRVIFVEPSAPAARIDFPFNGGTQEIEHARKVAHAVTSTLDTVNF